MIIWNNVTIRQRTLTIKHGSSVEGKFIITTWYFLFVPVFKKEVLITNWQSTYMTSYSGVKAEDLNLASRVLGLETRTDRRVDPINATPNMGEPEQRLAYNLSSKYFNK